MLDNFKVKEFIGAVTRKIRPASDRHQFHSTIELTIRDKDGNVKHHSVQKNLRTNVGADFWDQQLFKVTAPGPQANFIAMTSNSSPPVATDTVLAGELTTFGLARAQAADTHIMGTALSVLTNTFTYAGSVPVTIAKVGLFNALTLGTLVLETLLTTTGTVSAIGDTITINWTINF
jgi:hypothetical protein